MHGDNEQTLKRRRTDSNLPDNEAKLMVESNGVHSTATTQMADLKKSLEDVNNNTESTEEDVYTQLKNAESDLALAKDIGEALLAENIELREKYECLLEEHASQVEVLQQEKHDLQLKRKRVESIQEERIRELNVDLQNLQNKLDVFQENSLDDKEARRESVYELTEENSKLNSELNKVNTSNKELLQEINRLQGMQRGRSLNESFDSEGFNEADALQQRLLILEDERSSLNASVHQLVSEKNEAGKEVNLLTQKVITLTEELADSKSELSLCEEELNTCKKENIKLHQQLDEFKLQTSQQMALNGSIFSEISVLENESDFSLKLAASPSCKKLMGVGSLHGTPKPLATSSSTNLLNRQHDLQPLRLDISSDSSVGDEDNGDFSLDEDDCSILKEQGYFAQFEEEQKINVELRKEMCAVCHQLLQACRLLTNNKYESKQTWEMDVDELFEKDETGAGTLTMISAEVIGLLKEYLEKQQNEVDTLSKEEQEYMEEKMLSLESQVEDLTTECFEAKKQLSSLAVQLEESRTKISENDEEKTNLSNKITDLESEITTMKNKYGHIKACRSKSVVEELEKARRDVQKLDNQLIMAVNQKVKLSEQLEQWQYDMANVIEEQVQKQLSANNDREKKKKSRLPFLKKGGWAWT
ncbi:bicaudal D-related protein homolog [Dendronephthya gigantea]|uniref:bicaudal D-related protein homolog n=1 Tax=Dendronephthya gigantea TaxID=151771 RepID=UPI00106B8606|nr:bicaudal D-related protein homolog [Dendronephthya gigantea]